MCSLTFRRYHTMARTQTWCPDVAAILSGMDTPVMALVVSEDLRSDGRGGCDGAPMLWARGVLEFPRSKKLPGMHLHTSFSNNSSTFFSMFSAGMLAIDSNYQPVHQPGQQNYPVFWAYGHRHHQANASYLEALLHKIFCSKRSCHDCVGS